MARIRTIKPELFRHEELFEAEKATRLPLRLAFAGLFTVADREGRFKWQPRVLKLDVLPFDNVDFGEVLEALCKYGFLIKYQVANALYACIPTWGKHQHVNQRESESSIPAPDSDGASTCTNVQAHGEGEGKGRELEGSVLADTARAREGPAERVFEHWKSTHGHPDARLDEGRRKVIAKALKHYAEAQLLEAITGYRNSPHHMGENERGTKYDSIELMLRDSKHVDMGLQFARAPPVAAKQRAPPERWRAAPEDVPAEVA